jgi:hypothetical protein
MFRLAGHLKMTVRQLCETMDAREFAEWVAMHRYYNPLPDEWRQAALVASATLAPHCPRGRTPKVEDFVPVFNAPQHELQMLEALARLKSDLEK